MSRDLQQICAKMRRDCITMADAAGSTGLHFGGSLSLIEIVATLYLDVMNINKDKLADPYRDRLILSKGHGVPAVYAVLHQMGVISYEELGTFKTDDTRLYGHPCMNPDLGIEMSSGSLGQGLSQGVGMALALRYQGNNASRVFVILGDGECDEGSVWEAAMSATKFQLNNLVAIVDKNQIQYDGETETVMPLQQFEDKWRSFGWEVLIIDGHDLEQCHKAFSTKSTKPIVVIANTVKGKGISFMESVPAWHHATMNKAQREQAREELGND